jgi:enoyl-CoA hydratase
VSLITLNRPKALNALSTPLMLEVNKALDEAENDADISAVVLTGSESAFAGTPYIGWCKILRTVDA